MQKQIELLNELVPGSAPLAILSVPNFEPEDLETNARQAGQVLGRPVVIVNAASENDFDKALATVVQDRASGLVVPDRPPFIARGLMSYGASTLDAFRQAGQYVGKILQGAKPADMPVEQPTKFLTVVNLKTANAIGIKTPPSLLARADEVIE